jgi:hypothetical protein
MNAKGFATVVADSLVCSIADADWHFSIRRVDGRTHGPFFDLHGKGISAADVARYIPNFEALPWTEVPDGILCKSQSYTKDNEFKVTIQSTEDGPRNHQEVKDAFLDFLRDAAKQDADRSHEP